MNFAVIASALKSGIGWITDPKNFKIIGIIVILLMGTGLVYQHNKISNLEDEQVVFESNIAALESELTLERRENGNLLAEKGAFQAEIGDLEELNEELYNEVQDLKNDPITITQVVVESKTDTIVDIPTAGEYLGENRFRLKWEYENSGDWGSRLLSGTNEFNIIGGDLLTNVQTDITADQFSLKLRTGFRETENNQLRVYVETDYPNITFTSLEGAIVDRDYFMRAQESDRRRWVIGPYVGVGIGADSKIVPTLGVGLTYNVWGWD